MNAKIFYVIVAAILITNLSESPAQMGGMLQGMLQGNTNTRINDRSMLKNDCGFSDGQLNQMRLSTDEMLALRARKCRELESEDRDKIGTQPFSGSGTLNSSANLQRDQVADIQSLAIQGNAEAQVSLGAFYRSIRNETEATKWFAMAAEQGHAMAQLFLGYRYRYGIGAPKNPLLAEFWLRRAADQGQELAQQALLETDSK